MSAPADLCTVCPSLKVWRYGTDPGQSTWIQEPSRTSKLDELLIHNGSALTFVIADPGLVRACPSCKASFEDTFHIPGIFWSEWCQSAAEYYGEQEIFDSQDQPEGLATWFRSDTKQIKDHALGAIEYQWWYCVVISHWNYSTGSNTIVIFDHRQEFQEWWLAKYIFPIINKRYLAGIGNRTPSDPYYIHALFMEASIHLHYLSSWSLRGMIRQIENDRAKNIKEDLTSSLRLQDGSRHALHIQEALQDSLDLVSTIAKAHQAWHTRLKNITAFISDESKKPTDLPPKTYLFVDSRLDFCRSALQALLHRAEANIGRLNNEIQLAGNIASLKLARAAAVDAESMKRLALLGAFFLPPTFLSAIFSMSFFDINDAGDWYVHQKFWIFWAFTIPYALLLMIVVLWQNGPSEWWHLDEKTEIRQQVDHSTGPRSTTQGPLIDNLGGPVSYIPMSMNRV